MGVGGGPSDFIVNQSPNLWNFRFQTFDLDFGLDNQDAIFDLTLFRLKTTFSRVDLCKVVKEN